MLGARQIEETLKCIELLHHVVCVSTVFVKLQCKCTGETRGTNHYQRHCQLNSQNLLHGVLLQ